MEFKKSPELIQYQKKLKPFLNQNIIDLIIFGSTVKGGRANDLDIAIVVKDKKNIFETKEKIRNLFKKEVDLEIVDIETIHSPLWLTLIKEGYSVKRKQLLSEIYRIKPVALYKYSLKELNNVQKVQFTRGIKKVLGDDGVVLTRTVILVPLNLKNKVKELLETWDIQYDSRDYELLPLLRKETLF
ncbi:MAG: nucleotidyltransferase domain-containing protein [Nanoarchaeota archaeon]|nr:nucleotidyltransferase domain-containing protein [Nanoarchaeota archaeon]MBU1622121.1 nucleotidyltransferase domain-containing protein [Nanoarchaeota archaeon]